MSSSKKSSTKQDRRSTVTRADQTELLRRAIGWVIDEKTFADVRLHGNINWQSSHLVILAVLTAWSDAEQMTAAFEKGAQLSKQLFGVLAVQTFQGLVRALVSYSPQLIPRMWSRLQALMQQVSPEHYRIGKWLPLAVDGSRFTTPRTRSNEGAFAAKNFGKGKDARQRVKWKNKKKRSKKLCTPVKPQIWLTLIWHMGLKSAWCWKTGPSTASERHHFMDLLATQTFPGNTLFCADAGFIGYELWSTILQQQHSFLIRVGGNVQLLKNLGHARSRDGVVSLWPHAAMRRKQPPLVLRLVEVRNGRGSMFLVTNVLSERDLSNAALKRLYPLRWGIELQFRAVKQTFGRGKLRSRNADHAIAELQWSIIALTMIQLLAIREQIKVDTPPERTSVAQAIAAIRHAIDNWNEPVSITESLPILLRNATKDSYQRMKPKTARYQPNYKDKPSAKMPIVTTATRAQRDAYQALTAAA
jgi:hypothetical protein